MARKIGGVWCAAYGCSNVMLKKSGLSFFVSETNCTVSSACTVCFILWLLAFSYSVFMNPKFNPNPNLTLMSQVYRASLAQLCKRPMCPNITEKS